MCGIFGFSGKPGKPADKTKLRMLALLNEDRGANSTGIFTVGLDKNRTQSLVKEVGPATSFIVREEFASAINGVSSVLGHTRAATYGSVTKENAHPFRFDYKVPVVGVHNGFVSLDIARPRFFGADKMFPKEFDVDSMLIFALLSKTGGDFRQLHRLEGGITIAYMMPDTYPTKVFLYARSARNLHVGHAVEGMYFSSEESHLKMTGVYDVAQIPNSFLVVLENGEIEDLIELEHPKIELPLGTQRAGWRLAKTDADLRTYFPDIEFPEVTTSVFTRDRQYTPPPSQNNSRASVSNTKTGNGRFFAQEAEEAMGMIVKDINKELEHFVKGEQPSFGEQISYDAGDAESSLVVLKLVKSNDNQPAIGFVIWDEDINDIATCTMINGVAVLKYTQAQIRGMTNQRRTLVIADPVRGNTYWKILIAVEASRVLEVTLSIPFPKSGSEGEREKGNDPLSENTLTKLIGLAEAEFSVSGVDLNNTRSKFGDTQQNPPVLPRQGDEVSGGYEKQENKADGEKGPAYTGDLFGTSGSDENGISRASAASEDNYVSKLVMRFVAAYSLRASVHAVTDPMRKLMLSAEFSFAKNILKQVCGEYLNVDMILHEALHLREYHIAGGMKPNSVFWYARNLTIFQKSRYKLPSIDMTPAMYAEITKNLSLAGVRKIAESQEQKKSKTVGGQNALDGNRVLPTMGIVTLATLLHTIKMSDSSISFLDNLPPSALRALEREIKMDDHTLRWALSEMKDVFEWCDSKVTGDDVEVLNKLKKVRDMLVTKTSRLLSLSYEVNDAIEGTADYALHD